jgi:SAM-dependent methyltransferase
MLRASLGRAPLVIDVGCGEAGSIEELAPGGEQVWFGLDVPDSREARARTRDDAPLAYFDGVRLPVASARVDLVYSRQVFEHVRHPEQLLADVARVLRPGGHLVGSTSHLEPFHSRSLWNFTPYGFATLLTQAGFDDIVVWPGADALTLITRRLLALARIDIGSRWFERASPFNVALEVAGRAGRLRPERISAVKLTFCGHFVFTARRRQP